MNLIQCVRFVFADGRRQSQDQLLEIALNDHVLDGNHSDFEKRGIRRIREMAVDFSSGGSVKSNEFVHEVRACLLPTGGVALEV